MKKFILLFIISLFTLNVFAIDGQKEVKNEKIEEEYVTDTDAEKLVDKYTSEFSAAIESLAKSLEKPASHVYSVLITQQKIKAYSSVGLSIVGLIILILSIIIRPYAYKNGIEFGIDAIAILFGAAFISGIIWFFVEGLSGFINPEYGAIKEILKVL